MFSINFESSLVYKCIFKLEGEKFGNEIVKKMGIEMWKPTELMEEHIHKRRKEDYQGGFDGTK